MVSLLSLHLVNSILNSSLSIDEKISQLEFMKTQILAGNNPVAYFQEFEKSNTINN